MLLGRGYMLLGEPRQAIAALTTAARLSGHGPVIEANLGYACARGGFRDKALRILNVLRRRTSTGYVSPIDVALLLTGLGDTDGALSALEEGFRARAARMLAVGDPFFAELSAQPRYRRLLADLHLPVPSSRPAIRPPVTDSAR
jgi:hypothetical protein